jgi:hypothetical protein|tara:strand:+ start:1540 stop:1842 length:303 start_codon:yes stop_codon:yes gene_type:complete
MIDRIDEMHIYEYELGTRGTIEFEYEYEPGEAEVTYYPDGSGYPGSNSEVTIHYAWIQLKDKSGELIDVDMLPYIDIIEDYDMLNLETIINEIIKHHEKR